jgi:hypothetical protein
VHLGPSAGRDGIVSVWIDRHYIDNVELQQVTPQPDSTAVGGERLIYTFRRADGKGEAAITFNMRAIRVGSLFGRVGLVNGPALPLEQFIYP